MNPSDKAEGLEASRFRSPEGKEWFLSRAESLLKQGLFREAFSFAREKLDLVPGDVDARIICGRALAGMGKTRESLEVFEEIKRDVLNGMRVFEYLGDILTGQGEIERARNSYQTLIQIGADFSRTETLQKKIRALEEALIDDVSKDFKTMTMVDLYIRQGHLDMAGKVLKEMIQSDPGNIRARERLQEVEGLLAGKIPSSRESRSKKILRELDRWLRNLERQKSHG